MKKILGVRIERNIKQWNLVAIMNKFAYSKVTQYFVAHIYPNTLLYLDYYYSQIFFKLAHGAFQQRSPDYIWNTF